MGGREGKGRRDSAEGDSLGKLGGDQDVEMRVLLRQTAGEGRIEGGGVRGWGLLVAGGRERA